MSEEEGVASIRIGRFDGSFFRPVQVMLSTMDDTATSNEDFIPLTDVVLTFNESSSTQVVNVTIVNDNILEDQETFFVVLSTDDPAVMLGVEGVAQRTRIEILDDGKFVVNHSLILGIHCKLNITTNMVSLFLPY